MAHNGKRGSDRKLMQKDSNENDLFGALEGQDDDMDQALDGGKHQFLDNFDEEYEIDLNYGEQETDQKHGPSKLGADKVGDVIGQELDIEFDEDIQENIDMMRGDERASGTGSSNIQAKKQQAVNEEEDDVIDPSQVKLIDEGEDYGQEGDDKNLNRQTDNMADIQKSSEDNKQSPQMLDNDDDYHDLQDQLKNLSGPELQQQIIDDQNLDVNQMDINDPNEDEGQHYPEEDDDGYGEEMGDDDVDQQDFLALLKEQYGHVDPQLIERAGVELGLDEDAIRMLQEQWRENQEGEQSESNDQVQDHGEEMEGEELAHMINQMNSDGQ